MGGASRRSRDGSFSKIPPLVDLRPYIATKLGWDCLWYHGCCMDYCNKCMMVYVVLRAPPERFKNQSESKCPPGINEAPKAAPILWENQIREDLKLQTLIGLHDLWDQGIADGMMDKTAEAANKNGIYYETLNITELTLIGLKFCFRDHFSWVGPPVRHFTIPNTESRSERPPEKYLVAYTKIRSRAVSEWPLIYDLQRSLQRVKLNNR